jgi:hypothetical protein
MLMKVLMHDDRGIASSSLSPPSRWRRVLAVLLIVALPPLIALPGFRRPALVGDPLFYGYQLKRVGELNGRWWKVGEDPLLGYPYQNEIAKHAGLYEGVDLMLASAWPSRYLDAKQTYDFAAFLALAFNGWVLGTLVYRWTRSSLWTAVAMALVTWNYPTTLRMLYHLHLFKYGWALLAIVAFWAYLERPSLRRGVALGALVALTLQGSFYFGYLLLLALGTWWTGCLAARKLGWRHLGATCTAGLTFALAGFALTFPVWTIARGSFFSDDFFHRPWNETWVYGAELWQYLMPQESPRAMAFIAQVGAKPAVTYIEGWNFPGFTILLAVGAFLFARLRGWKLWPSCSSLLDLLVGLMAVFVVLSLAGGPGFFLFKIPVFSCFRSYGRAGLLALAAGCLATPLILQGLIGGLPRRWLRVTAVAVVLVLVAFDARHALKTQDAGVLAGRETAANTFPEWVEWLRVQPQTVRLAAFSPAIKEAPINWWGLESLRYRLRHGHTTLNGCDMRLLEGDLNLVGAAYDRMNAPGLRLLVALGYETLAFDEAYLKANPAIAALPWLDWIERRGSWRIARPGSTMPPLAISSLGQILTAQPGPGAQPATAAPPRTWVTGQLDLSRDTVVPGDERVLMAWADARGKLRGTPQVALFQHVFGPSIPAYRVVTPATPGEYELVFLDARQRRLAAKSYRVMPSLRTSRATFAGRIPGITVNTATAESETAGTDPLLITLENTSPYYVQTLAENPQTCRSIMTNPGLVYPGPGSLHLWIHVEKSGEAAPQDLNFALPHDLPPGGALTLALPTDRFATAEGRVQFTITPNFAQVGSRVAEATAPDLRLSLAGKPLRPLAGPGATPALRR